MKEIRLTPKEEFKARLINMLPCDFIPEQPTDDAVLNAVKNISISHFNLENKLAVIAVNKETGRFRHLPLGARFSYAGKEGVFVKITPTTVAEWDYSKQTENFDEKWVSQGIYSFGDDLDEIVNLKS